ncbi:MAG: hypothetical protein A4E48_01162 [Methanosaeta sp. PtaU1.Bin060]|nr:MAG: hypothetical protein A4E48_01162 [Methanosaeta sp. PtaU1.Bin060]
MVIILSFSSSMLRAAMIAGTLQPKPIIRGMNERPCRPRRYMKRSITKAALAIYPLSSRMESARKRPKTGGMKTSTDPRPPMIPKETKDAIWGSDMV